jgi:hypothetical protein
MTNGASDPLAQVYQLTKVLAVLPKDDPRKAQVMDKLLRTRTTATIQFCPDPQQQAEELAGLLDEAKVTAEDTRLMKLNSATRLGGPRRSLCSPTAVDRYLWCRRPSLPAPGQSEGTSKMSLTDQSILCRIID